MKHLEQEAWRRLCRALGHVLELARRGGATKAELEAAEAEATLEVEFFDSSKSPLLIDVDRRSATFCAAFGRAAQVSDYAVDADWLLRSRAPWLTATGKRNAFRSGGARTRRVRSSTSTARTTSSQDATCGPFALGAPSERLWSRRHGWMTNPSQVSPEAFREPQNGEPVGADGLRDLDDVLDGHVAELTATGTTIAAAGRTRHWRHTASGRAHEGRALRRRHAHV